MLNSSEEVFMYFIHEPMINERIYAVLTGGYFFRDWMQILGAVVSVNAIISSLHRNNKLRFLLVPILLLRVTKYSNFFKI